MWTIYTVNQNGAMSVFGTAETKRECVEKRQAARKAGAPQVVAYKGNRAVIGVHVS